MFLLVALLIAIPLLTLNLVTKKIVNHRTQKNAEQILDSAFNGKLSATYRVSSKAGLRFEQVLAGAERRGYTLQAQDKESKKVTVMVFKKTV